MIKCISLWIIFTTIIAVVLFGVVSIITSTSFINIFSEFEILLILIGFAAVISTILVCTKLIMDKVETSK